MAKSLRNEFRKLINNKCPELMEKERSFIDYFADKYTALLIVIPTYMFLYLCAIIIPPPQFLNIIVIKDAHELNSSSNEVLASIVGITMVIIGFIFTEIKSKSFVSFKFFSEKTFIFPIFYSSLANILGMLIVGLLGDTLQDYKLSFNNAVILSHYMIILLNIPLIVFIFLRVAKYMDYKPVFEAYKKMIQKKAKNVLLEEKILELSNDKLIKVLSGNNVTTPDVYQIMHKPKKEILINQNDAGLLYDVYIDKLENTILSIRKLNPNIQLTYSYFRMGKNINANYALIYIGNDVGIDPKTVKAFKIKKSNKQVEKEYSEYLKDIHQQYLDAVKNNVGSLTADYLSIYKELSELYCNTNNTSRKKLGAISDNAPVSLTIDGIEKVLYDGLSSSYQNDNQKILFDTISVIDDIIYNSITTTNGLIFARNLPLLRGLYKLSLSNGRYSADLKRKSHEGIYSKIISVLYRIEHNAQGSENEIWIKQFLRYSLSHYNNLLHEILSNKDFLTYKDATNDFYSSVFKKYAYQPNSKPKDGLAYEIEYYVNTVAILQYGWILYLYKSGKIDLMECVSYLNENKLSARSYEDLLDALLYIDGLSHFEVDDWESDIIKSDRKRPRIPLQPKVWANLGVMVFLLKNYLLVDRDINPNRIKSKESFFDLYFDNFQRTLTEIGQNKDIWIPVIFSNTKEDAQTGTDLEDKFHKSLDLVSESLKSVASKLNKIEFVNNNIKLVSEPFSQAKVIEYREAVGNTWFNRSFLHRLFENYGNWTVVENPDSINPVGNFSVQEGMKMMFVDEGYNQVYGSSDYGSIIADWEDGHFLESVKTEDIPVRTFNSISECLDNLIETVKTNKFIPDVIILGSDWQYITNDLENHPDFIPDWKLNEGSDGYNYHCMYKNIPLYTSYNEAFVEFVVVADFANAFTLNQVRNEKWYKDKLQVDTIPVDEEEARRIFNSEPERWKISPKGFLLSEEEAIQYLMTGVIWDIQIRETFEVKNSLAYTIGKIDIQE